MTLVSFDLGDLTKKIPFEPFSVRVLEILTSSDRRILMLVQLYPPKGCLDGQGWAPLAFP